MILWLSSWMKACSVSCKVSILSSFESRLMQLENSIIPVHKQTENLQRLQENVDQTLSCLDHVISYYHVAKDTDKIIREGWAPPETRVQRQSDISAQTCGQIVEVIVTFQNNNSPVCTFLSIIQYRYDMFIFIILFTFQLFLGHF